MNASPMTFHAAWTRLWQLAQRLAAATGEEPASVLEPIGLFLEDPARQGAWDYDATPANSATFASTGGDGVHFSALTTDGNETAPVVMTVPMAFDSPNHVLGSDLHEFLALGCRTGYFSLERLAYQWGRQQMIARLQANPEPDDAEQARLLQHLIDEFDLQPWPNVTQRLAELDAAHGTYLRQPHDGRTPNS
jgi:hypothetical protein